MAGRRRPHEETSREAMRRNGVPLTFENGVLDWHGVRKAQPVKDLRNFLRTLVLAIPVIGPFLLFGWALNEHAKSIAAASGAWLVKTNMDLGIVVFVGIGLAVTAWAGAWFEKPEAALSDTARLFGGGNWYPRWYLQPMANAAKDARDADAFLLHVRTQHLKAMGILTGVLVALGVAFATAEFENFVVAGPTGLVSHSLFPPFTSRAYSWSEATGVELTCVKRGGGRHSSGTPGAAYVVRFPDGARFDLGDGLGVGGAALDQLKKIDAQMPAGAAYYADKRNVNCRQFDVLKRAG